MERLKEHHGKDARKGSRSTAADNGKAQGAPLQNKATRSDRLTEHQAVAAHTGRKAHGAAPRVGKTTDVRHNAQDESGAQAFATSGMAASSIGAQLAHGAEAATPQRV